ncbi:MAG: Cell division protein SepF [Chroococcidiopsis sp. SAG 2025]|uniref:cell division protein SepF n=1 Tax=Chroococcidiopsis sp. SAG 2025 TaxID=171389 RepID=UPI0029372CED|nr:cell division protein SepF [Chroococcidiopsis sp. SAG 2025]MDV2995486.1 Cell division protein SepF [Chroococcidiopsis sp. SAG 2025]
MMMHQLEVSELEEELSQQNYGKLRAAFPASVVRQRERRAVDLTANKQRSLPQQEQKTPQVVVMQLQSFEQVTQAVEILWRGQPLVLNVVQMDAEIAQRAVDFVAGATYALEGQQQYLAAGIFLFAPNGVQLANAIDETCL